MKYALSLVALSLSAILSHTPGLRSRSATKAQLAPLHYYQQVLAQLEHDAQIGNSQAQYELGKAYEEGSHGLKQNFVTALEWFEKAASLGHTTAQCTAGTFHENGMGTEKNVSKAIAWFEKAAEADNQDGKMACTLLGNIYKYGLHAENKKPDYSRAAKWYKRAGSFYAALYQLGTLHEKGRGVPQKLEEALHLYEQALALDNLDVTGSVNFRLGRLYKIGNKTVKADMTRALEHFKAAAEKGHKKAERALLEDILHTSNIQELTARADANDADAQYKIGLLYLEGICVQCDFAKAADFFKQAAHNGHEEAHLKLAQLYLEGRPGVAQSYDEAMNWLSAIAVKGNTEAQYLLGTLYAIAKRDYPTATHWLQLATEQGHPEAQTILELVKTSNL